MAGVVARICLSLTQLRQLSKHCASNKGAVPLLFAYWLVVRSLGVMFFQVKQQANGVDGRFFLLFDEQTFKGEETILFKSE
jgi:hypothetical protein